MPNIIELNLLSNKSIVATMQGYPLANENSYKIVAGDENATQFTIKSKPTDYENATYFVEMVNAKGYKVKTTQNSEEREEIKADSFTLPVGMAVEGYGYISISCECDITSTTIKGAVITTDYTKISERGKAYVFTYEKGWQLKVEDTIYKNVSLSTYGIDITNDVEINLKEGDKIIVTTRAKPVFQPLKIKVWNTLPNWKDEISEGGGSGGGASEELVAQVEQNTSDIGTLKSDTQKHEQDLENIKQNEVLMRPINNVVKDALLENTETALTNDEKTSVRDWIGAVAKPTSTFHSNRIVGIVAGSLNEHYYTLSQNDTSSTPNTIVCYKSSTNGITLPSANEGYLTTANPKNPYHCANKDFVEKEIAKVNMQSAKMYLHKIVSIQTTESPWGEIHFNLITSDATPYTTASIISEKVSKMLDGTAFNAYVDLGGTATNYVRKSGVFYYDDSNEFHGYMASGIYGIWVGMLFGDGSTATLMLDDHNETLTDEVIEL